MKKAALNTGPEPLAEVVRLPGTHAAPERPRLALVAGRDVATRKWAARWLGQAGFEVVVASQGSEAQRLAADHQPAVSVVEAGLKASDGSGLCAALCEAAPKGSSPVLALCAGAKEARTAFDEGAADVARKPFNWHAISRRADTLARLCATVEELELTRLQLDEALDAAGGSEREFRRWNRVDRLTGLPNRAVFEQVLAGALGSRSRAGGVAVFFLDLDRFRVVNDSFGREAGDEILRRVAERLGGCLRASGLAARHRPGPAATTLARLSGDEFTLLMTNVAGRAEVAGVAQALSEALSPAFEVGGEQVFISGSVGVALAPQDGADAEELVQHAELATCEAKRSGGALVRFYSKALHAASERSVELSRRLRVAFDRGEIELYYQPLVEMASGRVAGAEALLRWSDAKLGPVSPVEFVPLAEEAGLMMAIGTWALRTACQQLRTWIDRGMPPVRMAINVSLCQLVRADLAAEVRSILAETGLDPALLELELSERGVLRSDPDILRQLRELKELGVRLSVDDFGTGNSAIAYLKRFPLDTLKIDQSYIGGLASNADDAAIASAMIAMAHRLRLEVVAEGVESTAQLEFLQTCGCQQYQGFLFSRALPPDDFHRLLAAGGGAGRTAAPEVKG